MVDSNERAQSLKVLIQTLENVYLILIWRCLHARSQECRDEVLRDTERVDRLAAWAKTQIHGGA